MKRLPDEFFWTEGEKLVGNSSIDRIIHKTNPLLLTQDPKTKRYRKAADSISKGEKDDDR